MADSTPEDRQRLDRPPRDLREDPRGQGAGAYTSSPDGGEPAAGDYGGGRGTDYARSPDAGSSPDRQTPPSVSAPDPALEEQLGAGPEQRNAGGAAGGTDFGRTGRSVNNPPSQGPSGDRRDEHVEARDPPSYDEEGGERWRAGKAKPDGAGSKRSP